MMFALQKARTWAENKASTVSEAQDIAQVVALPQVLSALVYGASASGTRRLVKSMGHGGGLWWTFFLFSPPDAEPYPTPPLQQLSSPPNFLPKNS